MAKKQSKSENKIFVLDTNILLHDPECIFNFESNDLVIPQVVLEELDNHKGGMSDTARNARQVARYFDEILNSKYNKDLKNEFVIRGGDKICTGKLTFFQETVDSLKTDSFFDRNKADNQILAVAQKLQWDNSTRQVILVSKDINVRLKARTLGIVAQDYFSDKVVQDSDVLGSGIHDFTHMDFNQVVTNCTRRGEATEYELTGNFSKVVVNEFGVFKTLDDSLVHVRFLAVGNKKASAITVKDYRKKTTVFGINAKNDEQNMVLNLLMDPNIDIVSLLGQAGTGKTLLTLACALEQVIEKDLYDDIIFTRATVSVGEEIGFLPGDEEEKMLPWMGALTDNLEVLMKLNKKAAGINVANKDQSIENGIKSKVKVKSISFMRGRTFMRKILIIDEAQNLSAKQMKTLITRAGEGTKIICMGNLAQIDTPNISEGSSGLTHLVENMKGWEHNGHITLTSVERSRLAEYASDHL